MKLMLSEIRKRVGMTQEELGAAVGATRRQIGAWERGENDMPMDFAMQIANVLGCTIDELAGRKQRGTVLELSLDERDLVGCYRRMAAEDKVSFLNMAHALALAGETKREATDGAEIAVETSLT